jgi:hypothetical protein
MSVAEQAVVEIEMAALREMGEFQHERGRSSIRQKTIMIPAISPRLNIRLRISTNHPAREALRQRSTFSKDFSGETGSTS